ncbi:MAG: protein kinase, partial [Polyangiales bacterium]
LKLLHARLGASREVRARFRREAEAAARIGHPGIVAVIGSGEDESGDAWIALELLQGRSLADVLTDEGPMPLSRVVSIVRAVCEALGAAHAQGIVHRDLKPDNVFLTPSGPKLLDFGVSKVFEGQDLGSLATRTGAALGTPYYMAPEQAQGKREVDRRADLYALGVVIFELLTGERPFEDDSYPMLVLKICTEPPPPLRLYRPDLPKELEDVVMRMLAKDPNQRFADCQAVKVAVEPFAGISDVPVVATDAPSTANRPPSMLGGAAHAATQTPDSLPSAPVVAAASTSGRALTPTNATPMPAPVVPHAESVIRPPSSSKAPLLVGIGILVALLGVGGAVMLGGGETTAATPPPVTTPPVSPEPIGATPPSPMEEAPVTPTAADTVAITINTEPADAELYLDGDRIPNPFQGRLPQSTQARRLEARKDGYRTFVQDLVLRYEQTVTLRLERGRGTDDRRASRRGTEPAAETMTTTTTTMVATMVEAPMVEVAVTPMVEAPMVEAPAAMDPEPAMTEPPRMTDLASIML